MTEIEMVNTQQCSLLQLDQVLLKDQDILKDVSDALPGWIHLNHLDSIGLSWMSESMQNDLQISPEDANQRGPAFLKEIIREDTTQHVITRLLDLRAQEDEHRIIGFIQMIRLNQKEPYHAYYTTVKISKTMNCFVCQTVPLLGFETVIRSLSLSMGCDKIRMDYFGKFQSLTKREKEILGMIAEGHSNHSIADRLYISYWTVKTHRRNILRKLETNRIQDLIKIAQIFNL
jgi:DNA-binding CsgD family transcriptional regulator